jgi:hypothetical protein
MYHIHCASARHFEAFAGIPQELVDKIVAYRKIQKRISTLTSYTEFGEFPVSILDGWFQFSIMLCTKPSCS